MEQKREKEIHNEHVSCECGHHHHYEEAVEESCGCGHHHSNDEKHAKGKILVYILENLDCANCAAKMEKKLNELPEIESATITFTTKQLKVVVRTGEDITAKLQDICASIESEVIIRKNVNKKNQHQEASKNAKRKRQQALIEIGIGLLFFLVGLLCKHFWEIDSRLIFGIAYLILGWKIILTAVKNIKNGHIFDENFLMSLATLAAVAIGDFAEAAGVMMFYRVGAIFEEIAVLKSRNQIMDAVDMRPEVVNLVVNTTTEVVPAEDIVIGDVLLVRPGDRIPLDGIILEGESRIDTSPVTGEPVPVRVVQGSEVISGCVNTSGLLKVKVEKVLVDSMVSRIMNSVENAAANKPKIDKFITKFARIYTPFVVALAIATAVIPSVITGDWNYWIYTAITFLVISCPCALVLSVPLAFFAGIGSGSKKGILFKGGVVLEALNSVKAVVMDKTGTITEGNFVVQECIPVNGVTDEQLLKLAAGCELTSTHPIGNSIVIEAKARELKIQRPIQVTEFSGQGIKAVLAEGTVLCGNVKLMEKFHIDISKYEVAQYGTEVLIALDEIFTGHIIISDILKKDAKQAIGSIKKMGITTAMLTGDAQKSADAVAGQTDIDEVYAKLLPEEKVNELMKIRAKCGSVMYVGDGINDAPVLAGADVGAAMGSGADAAIEAADVVFMTSSLEAIGQSLNIARKTNKIAKQNVVFALTVKALVMVLGLMGFANMWMAVFADTGVAMLCVLNSVRILYANEESSQSV